MANLLLAHIKRLFNWAVEEDLIPASPAADIKPPSPKSERDRVLTDGELYRIGMRATSSASHSVH